MVEIPPGPRELDAGATSRWNLRGFAIENAMRTSHCGGWSERGRTRTPRLSVRQKSSEVDRTLNVLFGGTFHGDQF